MQINKEENGHSYAVRGGNYRERDKKEILYIGREIFSKRGKEIKSGY